MSSVSATFGSNSWLSNIKGERVGSLSSTGNSKSEERGKEGDDDVAKEGLFYMAGNNKSTTRKIVGNDEGSNLKLHREWKGRAWILIKTKIIM